MMHRRGKCSKCSGNDYTSVLGMAVKVAVIEEELIKRCFGEVIVVP